LREAGTGQAVGDERGSVGWLHERRRRRPVTALRVSVRKKKQEGEEEEKRGRIDRCIERGKGRMKK
jgi:hypothetical protein